QALLVVVEAGLEIGDQRVAHVVAVGVELAEMRPPRQRCQPRQAGGCFRSAHWGVFRHAPKRSRARRVVYQLTRGLLVPAMMRKSREPIPGSWLPSRQLAAAAWAGPVAGANRRNAAQLSERSFGCACCCCCAG